MRRFALIMTAILAIFGTFALRADAGKGWCRSDPVVDLNGIRINVIVSIPWDSQYDALGPINVTFTAPRTSNLTVVSTDAGFNGYGESVTLLLNNQQIAPDGSFTLITKVSVPMRGNQFVPMQVSIIPQSGQSITVQGYTVGLETTVRVNGNTVSSPTVQSGTVVSTATNTPTSTPTQGTQQQSIAPSPTATIEPPTQEPATETVQPTATSEATIPAEATATP
jgi:hypothetical protein